MQSGKLISQKESDRYGNPSPDGRLLAVKTGDDIEFWDVMQGKQLTAIDMFTSCMAFSPDGTMLATYGNEYRIRLWGVTGK